MAPPLSAAPGISPAAVGFFTVLPADGMEQGGMALADVHEGGDLDLDEAAAAAPAAGDDEVIVISMGSPAPLSPPPSGVGPEDPRSMPVAPVPLLFIGMAAFSWVDWLASLFTKKEGEIRPGEEVTGEPMHLPARVGDRLRIGRQPNEDKGVDTYTIDGDPGISGNHADVVRLRDGYYVEDLGSTNGTLIKRGSDVIPVGSEPVKLNDGDALVVAGEENTFGVRIRGFAPAQDGLISWATPLNLWDLRRGSSSVFIGGDRSPGNVFISDQTVDLRHAKVIKDMDGVSLTLKVLSPRYGTAIIGADGKAHPLGSGSSIGLKAGYRIVLGRVVLDVIDEAPEAYAQRPEDGLRTMNLPVEEYLSPEEFVRPQGYYAHPMKGSEARAAAAAAKAGGVRSVRPRGTQFLPADEVLPSARGARGAGRRAQTPVLEPKGAAAGTSANVQPAVDEEDADDSPPMPGDHTTARDALEVSPAERQAIVRAHRQERKR